MFVKLTILMCPNAINVNVALVFLLLILVTTSSLYLYRFSSMENLIKIEVIQMTNLLGHNPTANITEWYTPVPSHINVNKIISITNVNQGNWGEYCNLDIPAKMIRVGALGNAINYPLNQLNVIVAYLA